MIKWTGRLSFKQYLPAKPIKRGIKVWMRCDSENAFLTDFDIYLGKGTANSEHGLGHDVVTKLTRDLTGKYFRVFLITTLQAFNLCKIYWQIGFTLVVLFG